MFQEKLPREEIICKKEDRSLGLTADSYFSENICESTTENLIRTSVRNV